MSLKNRKAMYDKLVTENALYKDDGALLKEFGEPEGQDLSYSDMTKAQLKEHATEKGLEFTSKATKDDLVVLLEGKFDAEVEAKEEPKEEPKVEE